MTTTTKSPYQVLKSEGFVKISGDYKRRGQGTINDKWCTTYHGKGYTLSKSVIETTGFNDIEKETQYKKDIISILEKHGFELQYNTYSDVIGSIQIKKS